MSRLQRIVASNDVVTYRSALLASEGFRHGFSARHGGVSVAPFDSLNLGVAQAPGEPDSDANIEENARRLMAAIGAEGTAMVRVRQVHGCVVHACAGDERFGPPQAEADALMSADARAAPAIRTADCVPVLIACTETGVVCAVHAGWRGIVAGVVPHAIGAMRAAHGARPGGMVAAIGPCIGHRNYEVGPEFPAPFLAEAGENADFFAPSPVKPGHHLFDLPGYISRKLSRLGVHEVTRVPADTLRDETRFFSYRRATLRGEADYGRQISVIMLDR